MRRGRDKSPLGRLQVLIRQTVGFSSGKKPRRGRRVIASSIRARYFARVFDAELDELLTGAAAVWIEGAKGDRHDCDRLIVAMGVDAARGRAGPARSRIVGHPNPAQRRSVARLDDRRSIVGVPPGRTRRVIPIRQFHRTTLAARVRRNRATQITTGMVLKMLYAGSTDIISATTIICGNELGAGTPAATAGARPTCGNSAASRQVWQATSRSSAGTVAPSSRCSARGGPKSGRTMTCFLTSSVGRTTLLACRHLTGGREGSRH